MMGPEQSRVQIMFGSGPAGGGTWVDVSSRTVRYSYAGGGRRDYSDRPAAGTISVVLRNDDGELSRFNSGSAWAAGLATIHGTPIRVQARARTTGSAPYTTWRTLAHGYVDAWQPTGGQAHAATITVTAYDRVSRLARTRLDRSYHRFLVRTLGASTAYWMDDDAIESPTTGMLLLPECTDAIGSRHAVYGGLIQPGSSATYGSDTMDRSVATFVARRGRVTCPPGVVPSGTTWSIETMIQPGDLLEEADGERCIFSWHVGAAGIALTLSTTGRLRLRFVDGDSDTSTSPTTGQRLFGNMFTRRAPWWHIHLTRNGDTYRVYVDGELVIDESYSGPVPETGTLNIGGSTVGLSDTTGYVGAMALLAVYPSTLSGSQVAELAGARNATKTSKEWVEIALEVAGLGGTVEWPAPHDWWPGAQTVTPPPPMPITDPEWDRSVLDFVNDVLHTEDARLDIGRDVLRVVPRLAHTTQFNASKIVLGTAGDQPQQAYRQGGLVMRDDTAELYTEVVVTRERGRPVRVEDSAASDQYGVRTLDLRILDVGSDAVARHRAEWALAYHSTQQLRGTSVTWHPWSAGDVSSPWSGGTEDAMHLALTLRIGDEITVRDTPIDGSGSMMVQRCIVEGVEYRWAAGHSDRDGFTVTAFVTPMREGTYWILGDSTAGVLGSTTRLAF